MRKCQSNLYMESIYTVYTMCCTLQAIVVGLSSGRIQRHCTKKPLNSHAVNRGCTQLSGKYWSIAQQGHHSVSSTVVKLPLNIDWLSKKFPQISASRINFNWHYDWFYSDWDEFIKKNVRGAFASILVHQLWHRSHNSVWFIIISTIYLFTQNDYWP